MNQEFHVEELLPGYVLGSLSIDEFERVNEHLSICSVCRAELHIYEDVVAQLALSVTQVSPPKRVKKAVLNQISKSSIETKKEVRSHWWDRLIKLFQPLSLGWRFVGLSIILVLGISNILIWRQTITLGDLKPAPVLRVVNLSGTESTPLALGMLVISKDGMHGTLVVDNLPPLNEEKQYQLWLTDNGVRTSGGVFSVSSDGYGAVWVNAPDPLIEYSSFGVTIEPNGGSSGPTGDKVLGGEL